ncbi:hypothetical protein XMIN_3429 [Xanthomonas citri pv. mangiferaeindicae LMG 941]|nr:hypothetical protein XMIN_3429 [Xanthomonas citri pv. mangiferaeindicae LMG 941]
MRCERVAAVGLATAAHRCVMPPHDEEPRLRPRRALLSGSLQAAGAIGAWVIMRR